MKKPKMMLIGLDAISLSLLDSYKGHCPFIRRLMRQGITGRSLPLFPVYTPTNWAALSTGADTVVTDAAGWQNTRAGRTLSTFDRRAIPCDTVFDAVARAGKKSLAIMYPSAYPTANEKNNMVLVPLDRGLASHCVVASKIVDIIYNRQKKFYFVLLEAPKTSTGAALVKAVGATQDGALLKDDVRRVSMSNVRAHLCPQGSNRWELVLENDRKSSIPLRAETWSEPIHIHIAVGDRPGQCVIKVKIFDDGKRLAISEAYDIGMLGRPRDLARAVFAKLGPPIEHTAFSKPVVEAFTEGREDKALLRQFRLDLMAQVDWIVAASRLVQKLRPYDLYYLHYHGPDDILHTYLAPSEGSSAFTPIQKKMARQIVAWTVEMSDRLVRGLAQLAGKDTTLLVCSDHGNAPNRYLTNINQRFKDTGLLVLNSKGEADKRKSLAWFSPKLGVWVMVNAREGTCRYQQLQARVLDALLDWKTPDNERVIAIALRKKDSHLLGYGGVDCGDVTFHYNSGFAWWGGGTTTTVPEKRSANHGPQMPATFSKTSDNLPFFILKGPRFKAGVRWDENAQGYIKIVDLLPTACHACGLPAPRNVTGAIRSDLFKR